MDKKEKMTKLIFKELRTANFEFKFKCWKDYCQNQENMKSKLNIKGDDIWSQGYTVLSFSFTTYLAMAAVRTYLSKLQEG